MGSDQPTAVVLLSGGLDSATVLAIARRDGFRCRCVSIDYGQRHRAELECAHAVARSMESDLTVLPLDLTRIGGSALTSDAIDVPKGRSEHEIAGGIPSTYVPARNLIMLSVALAFAEVAGAADLFVGVNAVDYSGYPDCRPEFIDSFEQTANLATRAGVEAGGVEAGGGQTQGKRIEIHTPLIELTKGEIIRLGTELGVDYALTSSCYDPAEDGGACGACDSCQIRRAGFEGAGVPDPTRCA